MTMEMEDGILEGVRLFNGRKFFEAHEVLEAVWLKAHGHRKTLLHGLIQIAAAFHHHTRGNPAGLHSLLEKGCSKLERFGAEAEGLGPRRFHAGTSALAETSGPIPPRGAPGATAASHQTDTTMIEPLRAGSLTM